MLSITVTNHHPLHTIADEIATDWQSVSPRTGVYFGAKPYLNAMADLNSLSDTYGCDSARSIVLYFLSNATTWKGETARRIKKELNDMLKGN